MRSIGRSSASSAASLLRAVGLVPQGPGAWGSRVPCDAPGVYVIETPELFARAPLDHAAIAGWLARVPTLRLDGVHPTAEQLADRLGAFWIAGETVVYVGLAGTSIAKRVRQFYRTALGDPRPHAGGHWLKTLAVLDRLHVWWAETGDPDAAEASLVRRVRGAPRPGTGSAVRQSRGSRSGPQGARHHGLDPRSRGGRIRRQARHHRAVRQPSFDDDPRWPHRADQRSPPAARWCGA